MLATFLSVRTAGVTGDKPLPCHPPLWVPLAELARWLQKMYGLTESEIRDVVVALRRWARSILASQVLPKRTPETPHRLTIRLGTRSTGRPPCALETSASSGIDLVRWRCRGIACDWMR